MNNIWNL